MDHAFGNSYLETHHRTQSYLYCFAMFSLGSLTTLYFIFGFIIHLDLVFRNGITSIFRLLSFSFCIRRLDCPGSVKRIVYRASSAPLPVTGWLPVSVWLGEFCVFCSALLICLSAPYQHEAVLVPVAL